MSDDLKKRNRQLMGKLLVIAVGIIGIAALYSAQVQGNLDTQPQTVAAQLAETIAQRIRTNAPGRAGYVSAMGVLCDPKARTAQPQDAAAQEAACWEDDVEGALPSGLGSITRDVSTTPPTYVVAVSWSAPQTGAASYVVRVPVN